MTEPTPNGIYGKINEGNYGRGYILWGIFMLIYNWRKEWRDSHKTNQMIKQHCEAEVGDE